MSVIHHLNCGDMTPPGGRWLYGARTHRHLVCHCLLVELADRLVLVDSGIGLADMADPNGRLGRMFVQALRPRLDAALTAARQIEVLGHRITDVRDIVLTHLDLDHVGGIADFPHARVHVMAAEHARATERPTRHDRMRYRPRQLAHGPLFALYDDAKGEPWHGFAAVRDLDGLPPEILMIPLVGHSMGHAGVAIERDGRWLLHCGDAYFHHGEVDRAHERCPPILRAFQSYVEADRDLRHRNQHRLRELFAAEADRVDIFCAHDSEELAALR